MPPLNHPPPKKNVYHHLCVPFNRAEQRPFLYHALLSTHQNIESGFSCPTWRIIPVSKCHGKDIWKGNNSIHKPSNNLQTVMILQVLPFGLKKPPSHLILLVVFN